MIKTKDVIAVLIVRIALDKYSKNNPYNKVLFS